MAKRMTTAEKKYSELECERLKMTKRSYQTALTLLLAHAATQQQRDRIKIQDAEITMISANTIARRIRKDKARLRPPCGGGGSGLGAVAARSSLPVAAVSAETMAPASTVTVAPAPAPMKGCVTRFSYQSLSRATNNFDKRLGSGGFGSVFQGVLTSGTRVAVKRLAIDPNLGPAGGLLHVQMQTEVQVLSQVQHPNVVQLLGGSTDGASPCLFYALMEGGSLQDRLACIQTGQVPLTANERILVLSDVARGLAFLHSEAKVIHRDVKVIHPDIFRTITLFPL